MFAYNDFIHLLKIMKIVINQAKEIPKPFGDLFALGNLSRFNR